MDIVKTLDDIAHHVAMAKISVGNNEDTLKTQRMLTALNMRYQRLRLELLARQVEQAERALAGQRRLDEEDEHVQPLKRVKMTARKASRGAGTT